MQNSNFRKVFATLALVALAIGYSEAATKTIPPFYRENPNARVNEETFATDYRLPNDTLPISYHVELSTNVDIGEREFNGTVIIELTVERNTSEIVLHARQLEILSGTITQTGVEGDPVHELKFAHDTETEFLHISTVDNTEFQEDLFYTLTIQYKGQLRLDNGGFYLSSYTDEANNIHYLATTQFESTDARHGFPCYDEPNKRATFNITIHHNPNYNAISNMPVDEANSSPGTTVFHTTVNMPTYLVAFIVSDFKWTEGVLYNLTQRIYSRPGTEHDQEFALVSGMLITERLGDYYGIPFALPKLDQVAVPDFAAGAMENWGLVTYREEYLLYNTQNSTINTQTNIANIIAHEYTHQWFGNLVSIEWWTYLWLKEGFATLFSYEGTNDAYPEWDVYQMFHTDDYQRALVNDASNSPRPMTHYVQTPSEISRLYDSVSYSKAGSVLHMWQNALTDRVFRQGLHNYLTVNQYKSAEEWQLFVAIATAAVEEDYAVPYTVLEMMGSWTQQGGYPVLNVQRNYNDGSFTVTQRAYYNDETNNNTKHWFVPLNYAQQSKSDFRDTEAQYYLSNEGESLSVSANLGNDEWLLLNKQSTGYYRINYDERNWQLITEGLIAQPYKIHPRNRAQLMHDAYRFIISSRLPHEILLELLTYLPNEDQYAPWSTANAVLTTFERYLRGDPDYNHFSIYMQDLVFLIYDKLGVNDIPGEPHLQKYIRSIAINLACLAGIESCLTETNNKLKQFINENVPIEPNLQSQILCNGLRQSGDAEFNFILNYLLQSEDQAQRRIYISALGCTQQPTLLTRFFESSIDLENSLRIQERTTLLSPGYSRSEAGLFAAIDFLENHWEEYGNLTSGTFGGSKPVDADIKGISSYVVTEEQERRLQALIDKVKNTDLVNDNLEATVNANIKANYDWTDRNRSPLLRYFVNFKRNGGATFTASFATIIMALTLLFNRLI